MLVAEVVLFIAAAIAYIWLVLPAGKGIHAHQVAFFIGMGLFPIVMNRLHGDGAADAGLRVDNLGRSARPVALATLAMAAGVVAVGLASGGFHWASAKRLAELCGGYLLWGLVQQYLLQAFALRRLMQAGVPSVLAAGAAAGLFAMLHAPNWVLVAATGGAGFIWCLLFLRTPNLLTLGLAHAVLGVLLFHAWPQKWLLNLTIGPVYVLRAAASGP